MKTRNAVRIISFCLAAFVASTGMLIKSEQQNNRYRLELENGYSHSLDEFNAALNNISLTLNKARFVTTPQQISSIAAQLLTEAETSKAALSQLPSGGELTVLNRFLSQVGNYAMSVSKSLISGEALTESDSENIEMLSNTAKKITELVSDSQITYNNAEYWAQELDNKLDDAVDAETLAGSLGQLEEQLADFPTLVYDGPYSDHILEKEPTMIKNAEQITEGDALKAAAKAAECDESLLKKDGSVSGAIPALRFSGDGITVSVSRAGGYPIYIRKERAMGDILLSYEQAIEKARRYLDRQGLKSFTQTYYFSSEGVCVVNFAFVDGETVCYTDLIKVGIAMDNGEIMLYEASGYISNHQDRAFKTPVYSLEEAQALISDSLTVNSTAMALIPTDGGGEARCYEFACTSNDGQEILIFINATTLEEESVLILLKSDGGTLVK